MPSSSSLFFFIVALSTLVAHFVLKRLRRHSISQIPGPKPGSWATGNIRELFGSEPAGSAVRQWTEEYGTAIRLNGPFGRDLLLLSDPKALQFVLNTSGYNMVRTKQSRVVTRLVTGEGLLFAEGDEHAKQRRIMLPSFYFGNLRIFTPIFRQIAQRAIAKWNNIILDAGGAAVIEMTGWLSRTTLDAIGEAGFDYKFGALEDDQNELSRVYRNLIADTFYKRPTFAFVFEALCGYMPIPFVKVLQALLPTYQLKRLRNYMNVASRVAKKVIDAQTEAYLRRKEGGKDIMSILIRANLSENPRNKLSENTLVAQMTTFMFAGHETTASTLSWALYELAMHPEYQNKLREEIRKGKGIAVDRGDSELNVSDLDSMKYLTALIKETLRFHAIVPLIGRESACDLLIPLSNPVMTKTGELITAIPISKGQRIMLSLTTYNRLKSVWGEDADVWRPERFLEDSSVKQTAGFGVISNLGSFGSGGRSCIGWRFAMVEMQTLLIEFVENMEFSPVAATKDVIPGPLGTVTPMLKSNPGRPQLPLLVSPVKNWDE